MKKNYLKGSYTVEAAVVVTTTIFVLAALILCTFYIHDRGVLQSMVCEAAVVGSNFSTEEERSEEMQKVTEQINGDRFLGSREISGNAASSAKRVTASWDAEYPVPGFASKYLAGGKLEIKQIWTSKILDPADAIRKIKGAGELLTGGDY